MSLLFDHQREAIKFLEARPGALLTLEMGLGKTRTALFAAARLYERRKLDRVLVLLPASVACAWREELAKLGAEGFAYNLLRYDAKTQKVIVELVGGNLNGKPRLPVLLVSYSLLPQKRHTEALSAWCAAGKAGLVCDESSFLKNRSAKQTRAALTISKVARTRWLLTGTPVANSPLDLWAQGLVLAAGSDGPLREFGNWYHFRARYAVLQTMRFNGRAFQQIVAYQNIDELTKKFAPYVLRREKKDCLDLPEKSYTVREVALREETWRIYQELRKEALLALPDAEVKPEPNAAVRLLRLCQLTSGHVGTILENPNTGEQDDRGAGDYGWQSVRDVSSEKLDWLTAEILDGELSNVPALIVWCRWRRERERLVKMLNNVNTVAGVKSIAVYEIYGGQKIKDRETAIIMLAHPPVGRSVLIAQPHAGGFGLNLAAASTVVYLSNDFSHVTRVQSEDRSHRIGQRNPVTYVDVVAVGPKGQQTVDAHVLAALRAKKDVAAVTCAGWRRMLADE